MLEKQNNYDEQFKERKDVSHSSKSTGDEGFSNEKSENTVGDEFELTKDCHHYTSLREVNWDIQKYWSQRHSIFSRYDEGIYMTDDSWFGVTPEPIARQVALDLAEFSPPEVKVLIDMFSGAAGNVIAFALTNRWDQIIAIEKDISVIACAYHNATIYNVQNKITWIHADSFEYLSSRASLINPRETVIFASPPWGGPSYGSHEVYDLHKMQPYSLSHIYEVCKKMYAALYLPRTSNLRQIARLAPEGKKIEVVQYCMKGASKALVAYIPSIK
ncbi:Trimethylguanosine synthase [Golovinomyces cichoracearum]|uniref:Trimethylguanosine synthase n=1 Tax=Golovinomyces cichoracearum TaxID=62708 RepID=A0A420IPF7_9PEZI|nr:Trimethylguanosine synthase [Golovinomyces cichoracearum]